jgi:CRISPR/Cas system-associated endonuclease Cas1
MPVPSDAFDSPGVDVALARALVIQAHENLDRAVERAVFLDRETYEELHDYLTELADAAHPRAVALLEALPELAES